MLYNYPQDKTDLSQLFLNPALRECDIYAWSSVSLQKKTRFNYGNIRVVGVFVIATLQNANTHMGYLEI